MGEALGSQETAEALPPSNDNQSPLDTILVAVPGMHCGMCLANVEKALSRLPGVLDARANLTTRRVRVTAEPGRVAFAAISEALAQRGYEATELGEAENKDDAARSQDLLQRLGVAGFAAMNVMLLSVSVWSGAGGDMDHSLRSLFHWLSAAIALPAVVYAGQPFFRSAWGALRNWQLNMDVPISLGVSLATGMSLYQTAAGHEHVYFDAAVMLLAFLLAGRYLDQAMRVRAAGAAANLLRLSSPLANRLEADGTRRTVKADALAPGDRILVAAGERVPADGRVASGTSAVDESLLTGEALPRSLQAGGKVFAGTINLTNPVVIEVTATGPDTILAEIARLMEAAEQGRGRYVRLADRAARLYAPAVHILGLATFVGWVLAGNGWEAALLAAIAVLIITCPCALALAVPAVQVAASSRLFERGVLIKVPDGLERIAEVDTIVFDKTGTLTTGEPELLGPEAIPDSVLKAAAALAAHSRHPYSRAIVKAAQARGLDVAPADGVQEAAGFGLIRKGPDGEERLGSAAWTGGMDATSDAEETSSQIWFSATGRAPVPMRFHDSLRPDAAGVVARLERAGFSIELLSGDRQRAVAAAASAAGISMALAERDPAEKIEHLGTLKAAGRRVLMVGDGLNDAPALAAAHASLSPATAADISQTASDAVFQGRGLNAVIELLATARAAQSLAVQNFTIAIVYNIFFVPLAVAGVVTPLIAAIAMSLSSITVVVNALRLKTKTLELRR